MSVHATHFHWENERVRHYFFKISSLYINHKKCSYKPLKIRFHCHAINTAQKNKLETIQWKKCHKRLIYKQFVQVSGLCDPQLFFTHYCRALYGDAIVCTVLVHKYGPWKSTKTSAVHFYYKSSFFSFLKERDVIETTVKKCLEKLNYFRRYNILKCTNFSKNSKKLAGN